jgi:hypothetical protein
MSGDAKWWRETERRTSSRTSASTGKPLQADDLQRRTAPLSAAFCAAHETHLTGVIEGAGA